jgi:hypothetical protein
MKNRSRSTYYCAVGAVLILIAAGCGGSSSKPTERELFTQTHNALHEELQFLPGNDQYSEGDFAVPGGSCTISVIAVGAEAPAYEGYPWTVESPDGEVAIKSSANEGALTEDCNRAIEQAMGW